ncbi:hypothetical protein [Nonomuraea sp. bgisy101]|uniref:hypothetical protein n=1 Tax=Nonomuraea sp. bgisy101 TaxID=3413784 RepID=UPI003D705DC2
MNEELARLLPPPAERDLPEGRYRQLKEFVMTEIQPRHRRLLPRPAILLPALGLAVAMAVGAPLVFGGGAPAYAIAKNPDGTIHITINEARNPEALQADLRAMGLNAVVDYVPEGQRCDPQPRSESWVPNGTAISKTFAHPGMSVSPESESRFGFTVDPSWVKEGQTAVLELRVRDDSDITVAGLWTRVSNGPVAECTLVDDPNGSVGGLEGPDYVLLEGKD